MKGTLGHILCCCLLAAFMHSCSDGDTPAEDLESLYELDGKSFPIRSQLYWEETGADSRQDQIRLREPLPGSSVDDLIILTPISGSGDLEGSYVYSKTGDIGTYDLIFVHGLNADEDFEWTTNGESGSRLEISKVGKIDGQVVYTVQIASFRMNCGYWNYLAGEWVSIDFKDFVFQYQGTIADQGTEP